MLRKLFKYEFGATGRVFLPMYAALLVMSLVSHLFYTAHIRSDILNVIITMVMVMLFTAVWVVTLVIIIKRFSTNLLGREGYLMHVLPVSPWQHVLAKTGTSAVWVIAGMVVSMIAFLVMLLGIPELDWLDFREFMDEMSKAVDYLSQEGLLGQVVLFAVQGILLMICASCEFILSAYAAMCIGQLVNRHRTWAGIGAYFGINIVQSFVMQLVNETDIFNVTVTLPRGYEYSYSSGLAAANRAMAMFLLINVLVCAAMFFVSSILLKKKLNLQ